MTQSDSSSFSPREPFHFADATTAHTNPWAVGSATVVNGGILALLLCLGLTAAPRPFPNVPKGPPIDLSNFPLFAPATPRANGGNGGGTNDLIDPTRGRLPERSSQTLTPPQVPVLDNPRLQVNPSIPVPLDLKLPDNPNLPNIGAVNSPNVSLASNGPGGPTGIGWGKDGFYGPGSGNGPYGPGDSIGVPGVNGVIAPVPLYTPEAEFSEEARRQKYQGLCMVSLIVDAQGNPQAIHVVHPLGFGLDEKAIEAVRRYRFKPATKNGHPVPVRISVAVNFRLF